MKIYLDMDGVCVDLVPAMLNFIGVKSYLPLVEYNVFDNFYDAETAERKNNEFFLQFNRQDWANLEPTADLKSLFFWAKSNGEIIFLTKPPKVNKSEACLGKIIWVQKHVGNFPVIFSEKKWDYSERDCLLIDDNVENCTKFNQGMGKALLWPTSYNAGRDISYFDKGHLK